MDSACPSYVTTNVVNLETQAILLLSLFSPLVELFPNLYMSWWMPSNGKLQKYMDTWQRRVSVVLIVWIPILFTLAKVIEPTALIWAIAALVFSAFGLRLYFFNQSLPSKVPEVLYFLAFSSIGLILYSTVPDKPWLVPAGILTIFLGAFTIGTFRQGKHSNLKLDIIGRLIFITGFLLNLYNLARAAAALV